MEDLNKNQLILLALLVSFVTSIATGIVTVTLMDQAPRGVTQTINHVVERTVEKVVTIPGKPSVPVTPVQVSEEESIVKIIGKSSPSVVKIYGDSLGNSGTGFVVSGQRIISNTRTLSESKSGFKASLQDNRIANLEILSYDPTSTVAVFKIKNFEQKKDLISGILSTENSKTVNLGAPVAELPLASGEAVVGQTAIGIGSDGAVSVGIISSGFSDATTSTIVLKTNGATGENIGGPLLNIRGEVVGLSKAAGSSISVKTLLSILAGIK